VANHRYLATGNHRLPLARPLPIGLDEARQKQRKKAKKRGFISQASRRASTRAPIPTCLNLALQDGERKRAETREEPTVGILKCGTTVRVQVSPMEANEALVMMTVGDGCRGVCSSIESC